MSGATHIAQIKATDNNKLDSRMVNIVDRRTGGHRFNCGWENRTYKSTGCVLVLRTGQPSMVARVQWRVPLGELTASTNGCLNWTRTFCFFFCVSV
ncbi:hypothetical protein L596_021968 [Steinernema carpocapsae]|uniref:Uncharacterized protein n=1 Tax=Steinernema carpocapsae TaxID=34508 RepID=A0A4V6A050_STECR|nr:hypothetical protein L596_021968 [Steinernema carpocapsae]